MLKSLNMEREAVFCARLHLLEPVKNRCLHDLPAVVDALNTEFEQLTYISLTLLSHHA